MNLDEINEDETDAFPSQGSNQSQHATTSFSQTGQSIMPVEGNTDTYYMKHEFRGVALIFINETFDSPNLNKRKGAEVDEDNLKYICGKLQFDVRTFVNLKREELLARLKEVSNEDHRDRDCLFIGVSSHGDTGVICAKDDSYTQEDLCSYFNEINCPTLAGKPKMIFIQACQGDEFDHGVELVNNETETDSPSAPMESILPMKCILPNDADFLICFSTMLGYYSLRNSIKGSWFIQALCSVLDSHAEHCDVMSMMTMVNLKVAVEFGSKKDVCIWKQVPFIVSSLTKDIFLQEKVNNSKGLF